MFMGTALMTLSAWLLDKAGSKIFDTIFDSAFDQNEVDKSFNKVLKSSCKDLQNKYPRACGGDIEYFFRKNEIYEELYKLLFANAKIDILVIKEILDLDTLPIGFFEEFITILRKKIFLDPTLNKIFTNNELYVLVLGLGKNVSEILSLSNFKLEEIKKIREILEQKLNQDFSVENFINEYAKAAIQNLSELNFIGLGVKSHIKKNRKKLKDVYVQPLFKMIDDNPDKQWLERFEHFDYKKEFDLNNLLKLENNLVILGNPGLGKSVLVKYLICSILEKKEFIINNKYFSERIPFRIELRKYLQYKREHKEGLISYLSRSFETEYGLYTLKKENMEKILLQNKVLVFFDGLDEIFNVSDKLAIKNDIENLTNRFTNIISIITSRIIGYEEAKLNKETFLEVKISDFNKEQIKEYTHKWYIQEERDEQIRNKEIVDFLELSANIDDELLKNPLLLSLIIILYRNNLKLPESKLEIYQSCTKTLVDKWDSTKELKIELNEELAKWKESLFADLAYWQY